LIRGAIFDLDGTLLDSNAYWDKAPEAWLASLGKRAELGLGTRIFAMTLPEAADYLIGEYGLVQTPEELAEGVNAAMERFYLEEIQPKPGVPELLRALADKGIPCAVASVTDRYLVETALGRFGLLPRFAAIVTTDEAGAGKNEPEVFLRAAEKLGSQPGETLVFEDALHALRTAKNAGFLTVGVYDAASGDRQEEIRAVSDYYLRDFSDCAAILAAL
jgi:HAD superfamily hydrolase (TIGR01509 family)